MVTIEDLVPEEHFLWKLEAALDLGFVYKETAHLYSRLHRPSGAVEILAGGLFVRHSLGAADQATDPDRRGATVIPWAGPV